MLRRPSVERMKQLAGFVVVLVAVLLGTAPSSSAAPTPRSGTDLVAQRAPAPTADDDPPPTQTPAVIEVRERPRIVGQARYGRTLRAVPPRWSVKPEQVARRWLRDGVPIGRATGLRYRLRPADVGHRIQVRYTATKPEHATATTRSKAKRAQHRVKVRRVVRYSVETRGRIVADLATFKRLAQQTFDDPRGWRGGGVEFRRVRRGGSMTLVLAEASQVPRFSSGCSAEWSCRVGRYVVINQTRWRHASPAWNAGGGTLRDYRHMVVNHESGHFLGRGHRGCPRRGALAPVMQQQSKGLGGCRFNPWPTAGER